MRPNLKTLESAVPGGYLQVEYGLAKLGDQAPYFTVTASEWDTKAAFRRRPDDPHSFGQLHERILEAFPDLADLVALHLSDIDGVPLHAEANGWYWYQEGKLDILAEHLRVPRADLPERFSREEFTEYVDAQRERWGREAAAAIEKHDLTVTVEGP